MSHLNSSGYALEFPPRKNALNHTLLSGRGHNKHPQVFPKFSTPWILREIDYFPHVKGLTWIKNVNFDMGRSQKLNSFQENA